MAVEGVCFATKLLLACSFGVVGTAVRYGLQEAVVESSVPSLPSMMALIVGCFVMGAVQCLGTSMQVLMRIICKHHTIHFTFPVQTIVAKLRHQHWVLWSLHNLLIVASLGRHRGH
jgi:fluoride ion exporter CrcB/FEX